MSEEPITPADEKALAMYYAYAALARTLQQSGHLEMDHLFTHLSGARQQLERIGESGAARYLGSIAENLTAL